MGERERMRGERERGREREEERERERERERESLRKVCYVSHCVIVILVESATYEGF